MLRLLPIAICGAALLLGGCGGDGPDTAKQAAPPAQPPASEHPETRKLQAADGVGYDGTGLRRVVDQAIDTREQQKKDLQEAQQPQPPQPAGTAPGE